MSKRCCPVCASLLRLLNKHNETNFVITDEHAKITSCALPEWLPGDVVFEMVREFSLRLRKELSKLQQNMEQRGRARTVDTGRMSVDSVRSVGLAYKAETVKTLE